MGLFLEMFNSGSRGVLCKTWILHTNNVKEVQKLFFFQARAATTLFHNQKAYREQNWSSAVAEQSLLLSPGAVTHEDALKVTSTCNSCTFVFSSGETRLFLQGRDRINQSLKWT